MPPTLQRRAAALALAALALLLPLVGAVAPAAARSVSSVGSAGQTAGAGPAAPARVTTGATRATTRAASGEQRRAGADRLGGRGAAARLRDAGVRASGAGADRGPRPVHLPVPVAPGTSAADATGPPVGWSAPVSLTTHHPAGRTVPVGAGRSPPGSCGL